MTIIDLVEVDGFQSWTDTEEDPRISVSLYNRGITIDFTKEELNEFLKYFKATKKAFDEKVRKN